MSNKPDLRRAILAAVMLLLLPAVPVAAKQVALVVGNARYDNLSSLNNPTRDAAAVSDRLRSLGFEVVEALDADTLGLGRAAETFLGAAKSADLALFYFAGHGIQLFDRNFLLARDVDPATAKDGKDLGIDLSDFMDKLRHAGPVRIALLIDACRDNPLSFEQTVALMQRLHGASDRSPAELARAVKKIGLADIVMAARTGSAGRSAEALIFFAAQPGRPSFDGRGLNSYFVEGLKEGLSQPGRPLMETFRKVSAYVRTVTNGGQVPQIVSDWTEDVTFGTAVVAAKVSYNLDPDMPEADRQLVIRTVSGYKRFTGDFIVAASMGTSEDNTLTDAEKERAKKLTSPSVLSLSYDFDRDGRDETLHVYFRQISYIIVLEQEGIRAEIAHCFGDEEIQDIEIALKDINGDRKPEIWIAMDDGNFWSRICILEFQGLPDLDSRRRANLAGDPHVGYAGFRTLLRTGQAAWNVTVGNDNSIKACAGTGCHSSTIYTFDGQHFTWVLNGGTEPDPVHRRPFRDEAERARQVYEAYRAKAQPLNAVNWQRTEDAAASSARAAAKAGDTVDIAYRCSASPGDVVEDVVLIKSARNPSRNNSLDVEIDDIMIYGESLPKVPLHIQDTLCPLESVAADEKEGVRLVLKNETGAACAAALAKGGLLSLPLRYKGRSLLQINISGAGDAIAAARKACETGDFRTAATAPPPPPRSEPPRGTETARIERFIAESYIDPPNPTAQTLGRLYGPSVDYYQKQQTREQVVADKLRYYQRWPQRRFEVVPGTLTSEAVTGTPKRYAVGFQYTFRATAGSKTSAGRGAVRLVLEARNGGFIILSESGSVLEKHR